MPEALTCLLAAIEFAGRTSPSFECQPNYDSSSAQKKTAETEALDGSRLECLLCMCTAYGKACSWNIESLKPFVVLANTASAAASQIHE